MAEDESQPQMSAGGFVFGFCVLLLVFSFLLGKVPEIFNISPDGSASFSFSTAIPSGDISDGKRVIANQDIDIRQEPGGSSIGVQKKRALGQVFGQPVDAFGERWWRVSFKEPPSGWVPESHITIHVAILRLVNIFPIIYDFYLSIWLWIAVILFLSLLYVKRLMKKMDKQLEKEEKEEAERRNQRIEARNRGVESNVDPIVPGVPGLPTGSGEKPFASHEDVGGGIVEPSPVAKRQATERWGYIQSLLKSYNTNDWKQAVIEADIMLEEMLREAGYAGDGVGDMLKNANTEDFTTLQSAWDGHKVRNSIAHTGAGFKLSKQEAEKAISKFKEVFEEFYYI